MTNLEPEETLRGIRIVYKKDNNWFTGVVTATRRGMIMVRGHSMTLPKVEIEHVWARGECVHAFKLVPPKVTRTHQREPTPVATQSGIANDATNLPIAPQVQILTRDILTPGDLDEGGPTYDGDSLHLLSDEVIRFLANVPVNSGFHFTSEGQFQPPHMYKVKDVKTIQIAEHANLPQLAKTALAHSTRAQHLQSLRHIVNMDQDLDELSFDLGIIEWFTRCSIARNWKASTLETRLAATAGALRLLPIYAQGWPPIIMGQSILWSQAIRAAHKRALNHSKKRAIPATWANIQDVVDHFESEASWLILLSYCSCARIGDTCRLRREDLTFNERGLIITFKRGKTTMKRGAYAVPAAIPAGPLGEALIAFLQSKTGFIFGRRAYKDTIPQLRWAGLTQHSVRRGAIHQLAASGLSAAEMIVYTGHANTEALISYLDDGALDPAIRNAIVQGQVLFGSGDEPTYPHVPSTNEILQAFPSMKRCDVPLHIKKVDHMDLKKLLELPVEDQTGRELLEEALEWLQDPSKYEELLQGETLKEDRISPLTAKMMEELLEAKCVLAEMKEEMRAEVFPFGVIELKAAPQPKGLHFRMRSIFEPRINSKIQGTPFIYLTSFDDNVEGARHGKYCSIQVDFISYYDQIPLGRCVRKFFSLPWKERWYFLKSLPMGLRLSVWIACCITWQLLNFPMAEVHVNSFIDNVRFTGREEDVIDAVLTFVERCRSVGATLDQMPSTREEVRKLSEETGDFLGVQFDYKNGAMRQTQKTLVKLGMIPSEWDQLISFKQLAVVVGLLNFAGRIAKYKFHKAYHILRRYREEAVMEARFPTSTWGSREFTLSPKEIEELTDMKQELLANNWTSIARKPPVDTIIFSDACAIGWGGVRTDTEGEILEVVSGEWTPEEAQAMWSSVHSEPTGLCRVWEAMEGSKYAHALVLLDHSPLVWGFERGRPFSYTYNKAVAQVEGATVRFCAGVENPADYPSRGMSIPEMVKEGLGRLTQRLMAEGGAQSPPKFMK